MNPELSAYLNIIRLLAALEVFVGHICIWNTACGFISKLPWLGGDGVVIFFVLSGYVIAYTAYEKDKTFQSYFIHRCARIYSVVLPALVLTLVLEWIGTKWFVSSYASVFDHYQFAKIGLYITLWMSFSSELWTLNEPILTNGAFWSLCFEVWFYIVFAMALFMRGTPRIIAIVSVAVFVGPKICALFPLWGLGVVAFYMQRVARLPACTARILLICSGILYVLIKIYDVDGMATDSVNAALQDWPRKNLQMAWQFPGYLTIAVCVAANIFAMRFAALPQVARLAYPVGVVASFTFTIYLTHLPLMHFFVAVGGPAIESMLWPTIATLISVFIIGVVTERRIRPWRAAFTRLFGVCNGMARRANIGIRSL